MRNALGTAALVAVGTVMVAACGNGPSGNRVFRDNFDSLASGWEASAEGVSVEEGSLRLTAGVQAAPEATYTFPDPYGPGWELETSLSLANGLPCLGIEVYAGDVRRHTWDLLVGFQQDSISSYYDWKLRVGDGADKWEDLGVSPARQLLAGPVQAKLQVSPETVNVSMQDVQVLAETVLEASQEVVSVTLKASRCRIRPGIVTVDWIQVLDIG